MKAEMFKTAVGRYQFTVEENNKRVFTSNSFEEKEDAQGLFEELKGMCENPETYDYFKHTRRTNRKQGFALFKGKEGKFSYFVYNSEGKTIGRGIAVESIEERTTSLNLLYASLPLTDLIQMQL